MKKTDLDKLMAGRNPLKKGEQERVIIEPANLYDTASLQANQQTSEQVSTQTNKSVSKQSSKAANKQEPKQLSKFASYLTPSSIKRLKLYAVHSDKKDYQVLQEAVDKYLKSKGA